MKKIVQALSLIITLLICNISFAEISIEGGIPQNFKEGAYNVANFIDEYNSTKITVVDVRSVQEYTIAHLEGAINIPLDASTIVQDLAQLKNYDNIVLFCALGKRASRTYALVQENYPELLDKIKFLDAKINFKANGDLTITPNFYK